jgi:hypothetical protein
MVWLWLIERDEKGEPVRMHWLGPDAPAGGAPEPEHFMPGMRDWARKHGLDPKHGLPDPEPCA